MPELIRISRTAASAASAVGEHAATQVAVAERAAALTGLTTYWIETWGCQMNEHDSEKMAGQLQELGLSPARGEHDADVIVLNTCSVREKASHKVFTRLGQLRRQKAARPHMILGVAGCVAQQEQEEIFARAPHVDLVMGPRRIASLPDLIAESRQSGHALALFDPRDRLVPEAEGARRVSRSKAYITIMEGCNKTCTFCIVPFTRGREACRSPEAILAEARRCVVEGFLEIELLGQNVNAWRHGRWDFSRLLASTAAVPGLQRVRFTTSHPLHFKDSVIDVMASHEAICPYLHLPVQSGSDAVLARMRRGYTAGEYRERVARLRQAIPHVALSTDVIVGFPGETQRDFDLTLDLVRAIRFDNIFSFLYSPRPHTVAADYPDDVPDALKRERLRRLQVLQDSIRHERLRAAEGRVVEVLVDGPALRGEGLVAGRTPGNDLVNFAGDPSLIGQIVRVRIDHAGKHSLNGIRETPLTSGVSRNIDGAGSPG